MVKKGLSTVVASIVMILIVVIIIGLISQIIIPMIKKNLSASSDCMDVIGQVHLNPAFTCHWRYTDEAKAETYPGVMIGVDVGKIDVSGFVITLSGYGQTKSIDIIEGTVRTDLIMYTPMGGAIELPKENEGKTYVVKFGVIKDTGTEEWPYYMDTSRPIIAKVSPIIKGSQCGGDEMELPACPTAAYP